MVMQMEEMYRECYVGRGMEFSCPLWACHCSSTSMCSQTRKLARLNTLGLFLMDASLHKHNQLLTALQAPLPSLENRRWD